MRKSTKKSQKAGDKTPSMTFNCINKWYDSVFEKLGWMVVDHNRGENVSAYKAEIADLEDYLNYALSYTKDGNRKSDLSIMLANTKILKEHADKDFQ